MARITGNLQADYVITIFLQLILTALKNTIICTKYVLAEHPQIASVIIIVFAAYLTYYFIKNAVKIIIGLIKTIVKMMVILSILIIGTWIYVRGVEKLQDDFYATLTFFNDWDEHMENAQSYVDKSKEGFGVAVEVMKRMFP